MFVLHALFSTATAVRENWGYMGMINSAVDDFRYILAEEAKEFKNYWSEKYDGSRPPPPHFLIAAIEDFNKASEKHPAQKLHLALKLIEENLQNDYTGDIDVFFNDIRPDFNQFVVEVKKIMEDNVDLVAHDWALQERVLRLSCLSVVSKLEAHHSEDCPQRLIQFLIKYYKDPYYVDTYGLLRIPPNTRDVLLVHGGLAGFSPRLARHIKKLETCGRFRTVDGRN